MRVTLAFVLSKHVLRSTIIILCLLVAHSAKAETLRLLVANAEAVTEEQAGWMTLQVSLTAESGLALADFTARFVGSQIDVTLDGTVLASPRINEPLVDGGFWLSPFEAADLAHIVERLSKPDAYLEIKPQP